jgi:hypothetical protein
MTDERVKHEQLAFETARAFFQQMATTRAWNAEHGGVYVLVTKGTQPNPYLDDPLRELTTDQNIKLTKINPAYMTRQISEISSLDEKGIQFHITSLKPIRPGNKATQWEEKWLHSFEQGVSEKGEFFTAGSKSFFRYMAPLFAEKSCLKCHAKQGYKKGDVRGGISVTLPHFSKRTNYILWIGHGASALFGVLLIVIGGMLLERKKVLLVRTNGALKDEIEEHQNHIKQLKEANEQINTLRGIIPICMHCKGIRDDKGCWNQLEKYISDHSEAQFSHGICEKCYKKHYPQEYSQRNSC